MEGLAGVTLPERASCKAFRHNFALARRLVLKNKWASETELERAWGGVRVTVLSSERIDCGHKELVYGCVVTDTSIALAEEADSLLHELFHLLDTSQVGHEGWEKRGWMRAAHKTFSQARLPL